LVFSPRPSK